MMKMMLIIRALNGASFEIVCRGTWVTWGPFPDSIKVTFSMMVVLLRRTSRRGGCEEVEARGLGIGIAKKLEVGLVRCDVAGWKFD